MGASRAADDLALRNVRRTTMMMGYGYGWGGGLWMLGGLLLLVGFIVLVVWAVTRIAPSGRPPTQDPSRPTQDPSRPTPNEILRERFARGEITEAEFEQAKKVLGPDR